MRSLALAEAAVAAGHDVVVAGRFEGSFLDRQLAAAPVEVVRLAQLHRGQLRLPDLARQLRPDVLHLDAYELPEGSTTSTGRPDTAGRSTVLSNMEDGSFGRRPADVVVDPTLGAELSARPADGSTWVLRGSRYTPLRRRVIEARRPKDQPSGGSARAVLVVMGGTDPTGLAPVAVGLLVRTGLELDVTVIAVGKNAELARAAAKGSRLFLEVLAPVDDLAVLMTTQDLVVTAAGTSIWELCCLGVPAAAVWTVDNQREGFARLVQAGASLGLGGPDLGRGEVAVDLLRGALTDARVRSDLVLAGRRIVDDLGAWRVVQAWETARRRDLRSARPGSRPGDDAPEAGRLVTRSATLGDAAELRRWRNDPVTRAGSRSSSAVSWDDHLRWLSDSLTRADRVLLLVEDPAGAVGAVRWDQSPATQGTSGGASEWEVSITVAPQRRGQSLARPLLRAAEVALTEVARSRATAVTAYLAVVHRDNSASVRLFEASGYVPDLPPDGRGFMQYRKAARVL